MTLRQRVRVLLGAAVLGGVAVSCGDDKPADRGGPSDLLTVTAVTIVGPASINPGASAQFSAILKLSDSTERAATSALWSSHLPLLIDATTGFARTHPDLWGDAILSVQVSLAGTGLTGQTRASREILVLPEGTFRMVGSVTEEDNPGQPIADVSLEIRLTEDLSSPIVARSRTDGAGRYRLHGVPPESYLHVRRGGYLPVTERIQVASHTSRDFRLRFDGTVPSFDGTYTMTIDATSCIGFTPPVASEFRVRTFTATIRQSGSRFTVRLSDAQFFPGSDDFSGIATPTGADMELRSFYDPYYYPSYPQQPDVVERLADGTAFEVYGGARVTGTPDRLSGSVGAIRRWQTLPTGSGRPAFLGGCAEPRLTLTRR
jgi:hypothetical protein